MSPTQHFPTCVANNSHPAVKNYHWTSIPSNEISTVKLDW